MSEIQKSFYVNICVHSSWNVCVRAVDDTLESILGGSDDEAEEDAVISQVLDEIGIEVTSKVLCIE